MYVCNIALAWTLDPLAVQPIASPVLSQSKHLVFVFFIKLTSIPSISTKSAARTHIFVPVARTHVPCPVL
jgi:hypothetical protein